MCVVFVYKRAQVKGGASAAMVSSYGVGAGVATIGASGAVVALFGAMAMK